jgi:ParB-like chromosome segregation protein Spo0J
MQIKLTDVRRGLQHRTINEATVTALMESFPVSGQISPIIVKEAGIMRERLESGYLLIAGNHRLTAAERLEWQTIEADIWPADTNAVRLEMIEVDENLCRSELSAAEKSRAIKKRKMLWESLREQETCGNLVSTRSSGKFQSGNEMPKGFAASTAAVAGMSKTAINQYIHIAEQLGDLLEDLQGTEFDNKAKLKELADMSEDARAALLSVAINAPDVQNAIVQKDEAPKQPVSKQEKDEEAEAQKLAKRIMREFHRLPDKYKKAIIQAITSHQS